MVNGGGVRAAIPAGEITYGDIINVHPFGNEVCMVETTGAQILDALEMGCSALPAEFGGFQQVSGLTYEIDMNVDSTVELDENGTKAAAVTAVIMECMSAVEEKEPVIKNVELTRPFAFLIYDRSNDEILFMGKVMTVS